MVDSLDKQSCYVWHKPLNLYSISDMTLSERATPAGHQHTVFTFTPTNKQIKAMIYKLVYNYKNILGIFRILYNNGIWISYINLYFALIGNRLKPASARFLFGCDSKPCGIAAKTISKHIANPTPECTLLQIWHDSDHNMAKHREGFVWTEKKKQNLNSI